MRTLVLIPAYNEEKNLERVIENLKKKAPQFDYIIINDGSTDHTEELCRKKQYHYISLPVNLGLTGAMQTGMKYAKEKNYDMAIQFDADGQHLPEYKNGGLHGENKLRCCDCIEVLWRKNAASNENSRCKIDYSCYSPDNKKIYFRPDKRNEAV